MNKKTNTITKETANKAVELGLALVREFKPQYQTKMKDYKNEESCKWCQRYQLADSLIEEILTTKMSEIYAKLQITTIESLMKTLR